jgi:hypothetical protein
MGEGFSDSLTQAKTELGFEAVKEGNMYDFTVKTRARSESNVASFPIHSLKTVPISSERAFKLCSELNEKMATPEGIFVFGRMSARILKKGASGSVLRR